MKSPVLKSVLLLLCVLFPSCTFMVAQAGSSPFVSLVDASATSNENEYQSAWFGTFTAFPGKPDWIKHEGLGYLNTEYAADASNMWFWSNDFNTWIYLSKESFPFFWIMDEGWSYFITFGGGIGYWYHFDRARWYGVAPLQHPYLYFTSWDIPALRERMEASEFAERRQNLMNTANSLLNTPPSSSSRTNQGNCAILAFAYIVTGEVKYAERAIEEALLAASLDSWIVIRSWNRGADLVSAEFSLGTSLVYDWCHDLLSPEDKTTLREAILDKGIVPYLDSINPDLSDNWWTYHPVNNWRGVCHGGHTVAALSLYFESSLARQAANAGYKHVPMALLEHLLEDSGGHEGVGYNAYGMEYSLVGISALQRFFGGLEDVLLEAADTRLGAYWSYYLHAPDRKVVNFGRHPDWGSGLWSATGEIEGGPQSLHSTFYDSLIPGGDLLLRWAADNGGQRFYWRAACPFYFIWRRSAPSTYREPPPELQEAVLFRGAGHAVFQSPDLYFAYSGGASHNRGDIGAFVLVSGQERLIHVEPSLSYLESEYQSTYLVDGVGQVSGGPPPRAEYLRFGSGDGFHYLASRIDAFYDNENLTRLVRHAVMVDGRYMVIFDDLKASFPITFEARFQSTKEIALDGLNGTLASGSRRLHILAGENEGFTPGEGTGGALKYISLSKKTRGSTLVTVLYPTSVFDPAPEASLDGSTLTVSHDGITDVIIFEQETDGWFLESVNGKSAANISDGSERTLIPLRANGDDASEVPSWLLQTIR